MIRNYITIALRNLVRHKVFSLINILGLAIGMTTSILILLWVQDELSYDRFHAHTDQIHRVVEVQYYAGGEEFPVAVTPGPLASALKKDFPEILFATRLSYTGTKLFKYQDKKFNEEAGFYADPSTFEVFTFPFVAGNPKKALENPLAIVITEKMARKYFGHENPLGKTIQVNYTEAFVVTGVMKNLPANSHLQFDFLLPFSYLEARKENEYLKSWGANALYTYVRLQKEVSHETVSKKIAKFILKHSEDSATDIYLQPLTKIHLYSDFTADIGGQGDIQYVQILSVVALFIIVIACINFMNLSTARSARRAKEVGLRKVVGANRPQLIRQFLGESILLASIAMVFAFLLIQFLLPIFNDITGKQISIEYLGGSFAIGLLSMVLFTGILSGSYPALFLSSFQPAAVLKGIIKTGSGSVLFRKILVVGQFSLSIIMIVGTLVVYSQLEYMQNKKLGFDKENIIYVQMRGELRKNYQTIKNELAQSPAIAHITATNALPTNINMSDAGFNWDGKSPKDDILLHYALVDYNYLQTMNIEMMQGRSFNPQFATDSLAVIINEAALKRMGITNPLGKRFYSGDEQFTIIGVMKDFHFKSLHQTIEPLVLFNGRNQYQYIFVKTKPGTSTQAVAALKKVCTAFNADYPFEYNFLDQEFARLYQTEERIGSLFNYFAFLAIFISCLGLFGLASFTAEQRIKEIGIRKVLGASVFNLFFLLSKDFAILIIIAFVLATPVAYWLLHQWLQGFNYRINISIGAFMLSGIMAVFIACLTVSYQSVRAALANPVKSLRSE